MPTADKGVGQETCGKRRRLPRLQRAAMKLRVLCFLLLTACIYTTLAQGSYENCCLKYNKEPKKSIKQKVLGYRLQETDGGCNMPAVVFTLALKKSQKLCSDPKKPWVKNLMRKFSN
ncbi:hypothetical protein PDJAM_G00028900 [Pangasius djambal]|uniref:Uncharacterized protein n=1 Tax=Pangasius djambal TaxID=1691987 RepID=A0ACC5YQH3_9TELE|nr:hypothetical protein [Pangasius djambal]